MRPDDINVHIMIWYFDEIKGQSLIISVPEVDAILGDTITAILARLTDIHFDFQTWTFSYSDHLFASQNIKLTAHNDDSRGGVKDFVISIVAYPATPEIMKKLIDAWDYMPTVRTMVQPYLFNFSVDEIDGVRKMIYLDLKDIHDEISQIFNNL